MPKSDFESAANAAGFVFHGAEHRDSQGLTQLVVSCGVCAARVDVNVVDEPDVEAAVRRELLKNHPASACPGMKRRSGPR